MCRLRKCEMVVHLNDEAFTEKRLHETFGPSTIVT